MPRVAGPLLHLPRCGNGQGVSGAHTRFDRTFATVKQPIGSDAGRVEVIALQAVGPHSRQHVDICLLFDPFGDDQHIEVLSDLDDRLRQHLRVGVICDPVGLCCTNQLRDSLYESSVVAGGYEQLVPYEVQDQELAFVQHGAKAARFAINLV